MTTISFNEVFNALTHETKHAFLQLVKRESFPIHFENPAQSSLIDVRSALKEYADTMYKGVDKMTTPQLDRLYDDLSLIAVILNLCDTVITKEGEYRSELKDKVGTLMSEISKLA